MQIDDFLYQKKLHEPLMEAKPTTMADADWQLLDRQALGVIRLTLARNVAFNIVNEMMIGSVSVMDHINEFNVITSQLCFVDIKFDDEVQALILLSSLSKSLSATVTAVSSSSVSRKFDRVYFADDEPLDIVGKCEITKGAMVIARGHKFGTLYITADVKDTVVVAKCENRSLLWHCRLGHMSEKRMKIMATNNKLHDLKSVDIGLCEDCVFGKQKIVTFSKVGRPPKKEKLEFVHTNVWRPVLVRSLGGSLYYVTILSDCIRKVCPNPYVVRETIVSSLVFSLRVNSERSAIVKESMPLYPATPLLLPHESMEPIQLGGFDVPVGSTPFVNACKIHRDPTLWTDPEEFKPERFLSSNNEMTSFGGQDFAFLPFGS
ncbi:germacrene A hydroxylase-like [Nymphaea colorata]|uniref:germacrene A hydroxylase-like n=1 Tax=Nymphaea colorata TaxID=210225 RepID=UPI00214E98A4|nr:germacrene A hydroxylase-like [Nymphaea colorata]